MTPARLRTLAAVLVAVAALLEALDALRPTTDPET